MVLMCVDPPDTEPCSQALASAINAEADVAIISFDLGVRNHATVEKQLGAASRSLKATAPVTSSAVARPHFLIEGETIRKIRRNEGHVRLWFNSLRSDVVHCCAGRSQPAYKLCDKLDSELLRGEGDISRGRG